MTNEISSFSNTGACTDIYAPGENVVSTWIGGDNIINVDQGTSMAAPHVTGVVAYTLQQKPEFKTDPAGLKSFLLGEALKGQVSGNALGGDQKLLLNNGITTATQKRGLDLLGLSGPSSRVARALKRATSAWQLSSAGPARSM